MTPLFLVQAFIAIAMLDVWLFRYSRPLLARGGDAQTMVEEFRVYGLPDWFRDVIRAMKLACAAGMVAGIWYPSVAFFAGSLLAVLMAGAVAMHVKVQDPWYKSVPATFFLALSGFVAFATSSAALG